MDVGQPATAAALIESVLEETPAEGSAVERVARVFALSLQARLAGDATGKGNLYRHEPGPRDMMAAFEALRERTPLIKFGHETANAALLDAVRDASRVHVLDLGIGAGAQWIPFLRALAARPGGPPVVRLTGIDLPTPGLEPDARVRATGEALTAEARAVGVPFTFRAVPTSFEDVDVGVFATGADEVLVVNAALSLHHVAAGDAVDDPERGRDALLARLAALRPAVLTLVEPDTEHNALPFIPRVREALVHYRAVFEVLESELANAPAARRVLEHAFFGREVVNVVAGEGVDRVERHERYSAWRRRLQENGFAPVDVSRHAQDVDARLAVGPPLRIHEVPDALALAWRDLDLLVVSAWRPSA